TFFGRTSEHLCNAANAVRPTRKRSHLNGVASRHKNATLTAESERSCSYIAVIIARSSCYRLDNPCAICGSFNLKTFVILPGRVPDRGGCRVAAVLGVVYCCSGSSAGEPDDFAAFSVVGKIPARRRDSRRGSLRQGNKIGQERTVGTHSERIACRCNHYQTVFDPVNEFEVGVWCSIHSNSRSADECARSTSRAALGW